MKKVHLKEVRCAGYLNHLRNGLPTAIFDLSFLSSMNWVAASGMLTLTDILLLSILSSKTIPLSVDRKKIFSLRLLPGIG